MLHLVLVENDQKTFKAALDAEMAKPIKHFEGELLKIRTGRAHTSLIEDIMVSCYGGTTIVPLKQVASLAAPDARLITIQPWDTTTMGDIERALNTSDLGLRPANDGNMIKIVLPEMSSSRREELVKVLHKKLEECRVEVRNVRKEFQNLVRDSKKDKKISEDFQDRLLDVLQKGTDSSIEFAEKLGAKKEHEITSF